MTLAALYNVPNFKDQRQVSWFSFNNADGHFQIVRQISLQKTIALQTYELDPLPVNDIQNWLLRHQTMHDDMNAALQLAGQDLSILDINSEKEVTAWVFLHAYEHRAANQALNI